MTPNVANLSPIGTNNPPIVIHWNVMARAKFKFGDTTSQHEPVGRQFAPLHSTVHLIGDTRRHSKFYWRTLAHTVAHWHQMSHATWTRKHAERTLIRRQSEPLRANHKIFGAYWHQVAPAKWTPSITDVIAANRNKVYVARSTTNSPSSTCLRHR